MAKTIEEKREYKRKWRLKHKNRLNAEAKKKRIDDPELTRRTWDNHMFGGHSQEVFERDNFECQECGMTQEQHFILFNRRLDIHHKDFKGRRHPEPNNDVDNLVTVCLRCHARIHREREMLERWGGLMDQDSSDWAFPKLRELVENEISKGAGVQEAKRIVCKNTGIGFSTVDHRYYEKKDNTRSVIQRRRNSKQGGKKK